ncbi:unnamed protein product [Penicillium olsonii]|uniref:Uncharacterized protein n=1 Tax=Penicillium olsonii TaxID=99116 RepID=A0A9W4HMD5_PENOL|nr:unnamed protein product [Penicillium olsonii]
MATPLTEEAGPTDYPEDYGKRLKNYRPKIQALNVETEQQRAALSQRRNLLFTAQGYDIYVWIPRGSNQLLGSQPEMIIRPVMNKPHASGYIAPARPHTINHIIVDDLGTDEVLLLATDSGNVTGYHVEAIYSAIGRCVKLNNKQPFDGVEVKPFFVEYVGKSAWGLATHKFARLIAVSANTGYITVFAFAMVDDELFGDGSSSDTSEIFGIEQSSQLGQTWLVIEDDEELAEVKRKMPNHRTRNLRLHYAGHYENIPCVSFANFDLDPNGTWMISTDILNRVLVWRVWDAMGPVKESTYGHPRNNRPERGWFVLPIDPRRVQKHRLKVDACGCIPMDDPFENQIIFDTSDSIHSITEWPTKHSPSYHQPLPTRHYLPDDVFSPDCITRQRSATRFPSPGPDLSPVEPPFDGSHTEAIDDLARNSDTDHESVCDVDAENRMPENPPLRMESGIVDLVEDANEHFDPFKTTPNTINDFETHLELQQRYLLHPQNPQFYPVIHFSEHDISLASYPCDARLQILAQSPLTNTAPRNLRIHQSCDRMNMIKYIPELGLIIAASQEGRVAIISLTWQAEIGHSFRIDWIVPFDSQVTDPDYPKVPLMGMAVSPMPGFEQPPDIPCIPRDVDPKEWLKFDYRLLNPEKDASSDISSESASPHRFNPNTDSPNNDESLDTSGSNSDSRRFKSDRDSPESPSAGQNDQGSAMSPSLPPSNPDSNGSEDDGDPSLLTIPELHSRGSAIYRPRENWHGWHPSRHYRLLLLFCNHTVMSYEFWHTWMN